MVLINRDQCVPPRAIAARARVADIICPSGPTTTTSPIKSAIATSAGTRQRWRQQFSRLPEVSATRSLPPG